MKKILTIVVTLFCFTTSYAQETTPTKEETMDWIAEKIKSVTMNYSEIEYSMGIYTYKTKSTSTIQLSISLNNLTSFETSDDGFTLKGIKIATLKDSYDGFLVDHNTAPLYSSDGTMPGINTKLFSQDMKQRFKKALEVLIQYNTAGKNEAF